MSELPDPPGPGDEARPMRRIERPVAFMATMGGGLCLFAIVNSGSREDRRE